MLNLEPLLLASPAIQTHAVAAMIAAVTGLFTLFAPKGTAGHRLLGRVFVLAMGVTALSSFLIHEIRSFGPFSMIHLLSIFVLFSLVQAIRAIRRGQVHAHRQGMISTYIGGIVIAGGFTFLPGRMMAKITYGGMEGDFPILWLFLAFAGVWLLIGLLRIWKAGSGSRSMFRS